MKAGPAESAEAKSILAGLMIVALAAVAYLPVITRGGFIWDDPQYVLNNPTLRSPAGLVQMWTEPTSLPQWYPLTHTTFWIEYLWWGPRPTGYHVTNVLLHAASAILLWRLLVILEVPGAWLAGAIFAVHPVCVESVAWVTERKNVLSMLFYLLALRAYLVRVARVTESTPKPDLQVRVAPRAIDWRGYALALFLFVCALLSKSVTATLPAAILLIIWWKRNRITPRDVALALPSFALGISMSIVTSILEHAHVGADPSKIHELNFSIAQRLFIAGRAVWFYAGKLFWPANLVFIYPRWPSVEQAEPWLWQFPLSAIALIVALFMLRQRLGRGPVTAVLFLCGTLVPALGFVSVYPMRFSFVADHFQYHASVGLIALFAAIVWRFMGKTQAPVAAAVILVSLGIVTFRRTFAYENKLALWSATYQANPNSWMVATNLGNALAALKRYDEAMPFYDRAFELAPDLDETNWNEGTALVRRGRIDEAENRFRRVIELNPGYATAYLDLGKIYLFRRTDPKAAEPFLIKALEIAPNYAEANLVYGVLLDREGRLGEAIEHFRAATEAQPDSVEAWQSLGAAQLKRGQRGEAEQSFGRAAEALLRIRAAEPAQP